MTTRVTHEENPMGVAGAVGLPTEPQPKRLTVKMERDYVKAGGCKCLYCGSDQIEGGSIDIEYGAAYQKISCLDCERAWVDSYKLVGVIE